MVLVDTSVWIDHLVRGDVELEELLNRNRVLAHPMVIGEIACGALKNRHNVLGLLSQLPTAPVATDREALAFIESHRLWGVGLGYVDVQLLASAKLAGSAGLLTRDRALGRVAGELGLVSR